MTRVLLFGVCIRAPDSWKFPRNYNDRGPGSKAQQRGDSRNHALQGPYTSAPSPGEGDYLSGATWLKSAPMSRP